MERTPLRARRPRPRSESIAELVRSYPGEITVDENSGFLVSTGCLFVQAQRDDDVDLPEGSVSHVSYRKYLYFIVPEDFESEHVDLKRRMHRIPVADITEHGVAYIADVDDWATIAATEKVIRAYDGKVAAAVEARKEAEEQERRRAKEQERLDTQARWEREQAERIEGYTRPNSIFSVAWTVEEDGRHLVRNLFPDNAVSLVFGKYDEFKTTLIYDLAGSVALGCKFLGFDIPLPRPVVIYALEGSVEAPERLRAIAAKLAKRNPAWGTVAPPPITVFDRIPETDVEWRRQLRDVSWQFGRAYDDYNEVGLLPRGPWERGCGFKVATEADIASGGEVRDYASPEDIDYSYRGLFKLTDGDRMIYKPALGQPLYPMPDDTADVDGTLTMPLVIVDTLSLALAGDAETGPAAPGFIGRCLDLMKQRPDLDNEDEEIYDGRIAASAVIVIHHPTKSGDDYGGHRAIAGNTQALYRVHRAGTVHTPNRPMTATLTPHRTKGMAKPGPVRFEAEVVPIPGLESGRKTVILKDAQPAVPTKLVPIVPKLAELGAGSDDLLSRSDINGVLDDLGKSREMRNRYLGQLVDAGILEPVTDDAENVTGYRLHV